MLSGEATNTNSKVFCWTRTGLEPAIYHTPGKHTFLSVNTTHS